MTVIIKALDVECLNEKVAISFSDDDIAKLLLELKISFKRTLQKICIRMKIFSNKIK